LGGTIAWEEQAGKGHADIDFSQALTWIVDRFAGKLVANDCR
jgi:hypothetical protein